MSDPLIEVHDMAHGGEGVGRHHGKTIFVAGAIPGERVKVRISHEKASWARAELAEVIEPAESRRSPPCSHFGACGGCQWQYLQYQAQLQWKASIVAGQLRHLGQITDALLDPIVAPGPPFAYRNRMTFHVADGRGGLYRVRSRELVPLSACLLLTPLLAELYPRLVDLDGVRELTLRAGVRTGELLALVKGKVPAGARTWGVQVAHLKGRSFEPVIGEAHLHELVAGVRFRISGVGFFQVNTNGADALVRLVEDALQPAADETLLDAYAGVGLFSATVGRSAGRVVAVESNSRAAADLHHNLAGAGVGEAEVVGGRLETVPLTGTWDVAVCDPPRAGLGRAGIEAVTSGSPRRLAYVSCDPASLARDARMLAEYGYALVQATPVDLFPQTFHIETVARFDRL